MDQNWKKEVEEQKKHMQDMLKNLTDTWQENPERIAEVLEFGSRVYQYSARNNLLIYAQNPHATYVQSFKAWNEMGASVKKGEKGCKVYVPVQATVLKIDGHLVPLEQATKEQKLQYKAGEIESITKRYFKTGTVFDISQTTYPKENYPKLFHMGYESVLHAAVVKGMEKYARQELECQVEEKELKSISLRGNYNPKEHKIQLNKLLEDTEKLSTMSHELGHALLHRELPVNKSTAQIELEADALSIMFSSHFGIDLTESRKRHFVNNYHKYQKTYIKAPEEQKPDSFGRVISNVFETFRKEFPILNKYVENSLQKEEKALIKQGMKKYPELEASPDKEEIYDRIKQEINILDYAGMHGIELQRVGRYYTIKDHDSVRIDPDKNCFWRNSGVGQTTTGSVIDFANAFVHNDDLHESLKELSALVGESQSSAVRATAVYKKESNHLGRKSLEENLPERAKNMHRAYAYLTQTRFIEPEIVQDFVDQKMLYQDTRGNCVFVAYDQEEKPVFASFRGTLSERKFLGDVSGSNYKEGFYIHNGAEKLIVTESVIDAMSIMSILHGQGIDFKQYDYLPLNGADKHETLLTHLKDSPEKQVLLALDHDLAGVKNMQLLKENMLEQFSGLGMRADQITFHVPHTKDWNEELLNTMRHLRSINEIDFLKSVKLPEIHYCAVQSTLNVEELGFHKRDGRHQYRLVELTAEGKIEPMNIKKNIIFYQPEDLKQNIPNMYEEVPYKILLQMQEKQQNMQSPIPEQRLLDQNQESQVSHPANELVIKGFEMSEGMIIAKTVIEGVEAAEEVCRQGERYFITSGYEFDHTYVEHDLSEEQKEELENYIAENDIKLDEDLMVLMEKDAAEHVKGMSSAEEKKGVNFLNALQQQEFDQGSVQLEPEMGIGIGG